MLPNIGSKGSTTKDQVISILGREWPLSAKELFNKAKKEYASTVSYQAVHKSIEELIEQGVIEKKGKSVQLDQQWIEHLKQFSTTLENNYQKKGSGKLLTSPDGSHEIVFDDLSVFCTEMAKMWQSKEIVNVDDFQVACMFNHLWFPPKFSFDDFALLERMTRVHHQSGEAGHIIGRHDTPFDRWVQEQYYRVGADAIKIGVPFYSETDLAALGEHVFEVSFSPETKKIMDFGYQKSQNLEDWFLLFKQNKYEKYPFHIEVKISKNKQIARTIQEYVKGFF